ncbi:NAD(P)-dependent oxidoreductase [Novosphingobium profundi]|uniref:NAD(P)-dependent oxidoreductase n=1 Tax=Novosphingobium profundi TaxID=1774954 RepID=UPI0021F5940E|nr:NAD(P)-dependent oxidoreductase [Novosphingobium profundi]
MNVGIIGLGAMGSGMARTLVAAGYTVFGLDPAIDATVLELGDNFTVCSAPTQLTARCETIILSLPNAAIVEDVVAGNQGLILSGREGLVLIDTSTSHPDTSKALAARLSERGIAFVDAPVSGGPAAANTGAMGMVLGGKEEDIARVAPVLDAMTRIRTHVGPVGAGHAVKIINNALCAANLLLGAEAVRLGQAYGIEAGDVITGVNSGSGRSGVTEVNFPRWILSDDFDSGFTMKLMRKDVRLARDLIGEAGLDLAMMASTIAQWAQSEDTVADESDFNCIVKTVLKD